MAAARPVTHDILSLEGAQPRSCFPQHAHAGRVRRVRIASPRFGCVLRARSAQNPHLRSARCRRIRIRQGAPDPPGLGSVTATSRYFASEHCPRTIASAHNPPDQPAPSGRFPRTRNRQRLREYFYLRQSRHFIGGVVNYFSWQGTNQEVRER